MIASSAGCVLCLRYIYPAVIFIPKLILALRPYIKKKAVNRKLRPGEELVAFYQQYTNGLITEETYLAQREEIFKRL